MKKVFAKKDVAPAWVKQNQPEGRNARHTFYFSGDTIYSYGFHFPIAKFFDAPNGEKVVLITTRSHSISTSKHCSYVSRALYACPLRKIYCEAIAGGEHPQNLNGFHAQVVSTGYKHDHARLPRMIDHHAERIHALLLQTRDYCEVMLLPVPAWAMLPKDIPAGKSLTSAMMVHTAAMHI